MSINYLRILLYCFLVFQFLQTSAQRGMTSTSTEDSRYALIIGNQSYKDIPLKNAVNDANLMEMKLRNLGFEVSIHTNLDQRAMKRAIIEFGSKLNSNSISLVFYAGHGMEINKTNYLIPVDAEISKEADVDIESVSIESLLQQLADSGCRKNLLILDACRNNPFLVSRGGPGRTLGKINTSIDVKIIYATVPGSTASDGLTGNGLFTAAFAAQLDVPNLDLNDVLINTREKVIKDSKGQQKPYTEGTDFKFVFNRQIQSVFSDRDGDGIADSKDKCPDEYGEAMYDGCKQPMILDSDGDGLADDKDQCPYETGELSNNGCPKPKNKYSHHPAAMQAALESIEASMSKLLGGTFAMGCTSEQGNECYDDEKPARTVRVKPFNIARYEVTQSQYEAIMGPNPSHFTGCETCPVEKVSWYDVQAFIKKLNELSGESYRLPTEEEWEYAARTGGQGTKYSGSSNADLVSWHGDNSGSKTHAVGRKKANGFGLYDMSGNVWEWTASDYNASNKVIRGGSWYNEVRNVRTSSRVSSNPGLQSSGLGFRLCTN